MTALSPTTLIAFHGTTAGRFESFEPKIRKGEQLGFGIHFSSDPSFAKLYATDPFTARKGKQPTIYIVELEMHRLLLANKIVKEGTREFEFAKKLAGRKFWSSKDEDGIPCAWLQSALDATSPVRARELISEAGYDSVRYESVLGTRGLNARVIAKSLSYLVLSSDQIRIISSLDLTKAPLLGCNPSEQDMDLKKRVRQIMVAAKAEKIANSNDNEGSKYKMKGNQLP